MRVFVTGATGWIGSALVPELLRAGHEVTALVRPGRSAEALTSAGVRIHHGDLEDVANLRRGAATADGVMHLAYFNGFSNPRRTTRLRVLLGGSPRGIVSRFGAAGAGVDKRAIETFGAVLADSGGPLVVAFPTFAVVPGTLATEPATEMDAPSPLSPGAQRIPSEETTLALAAQGVRASVIRIPPSVHGDGDTGLVPQLIKVARKKGVSVYLGEGRNRWSAVHRDDVAHLFRLALEKGVAGARYHAVADEGVEFRTIAEAIGEGLRVPVETRPNGQASRRFGWLGPFAAGDNYVSSTLTRKELGWRPTGPDLLTDIAQTAYFVGG
ncbi:Nucleoside-diphosphate-sugar epimerase [Streptomyces sp. DvalAA-14]|uniref:SDR family oxidoreductase n=1 Tax=unclassified Streptomyces TaxID=2593676 RepID=UPI00081B5A33|nr:MULTISPECIES: SDR family oxidoreductase [unclassified Streptomyces]MYS20124.1 NAD-dependent epimerase/dehydratase family protein [Streptomyces sp. SID4948]SCD61424.1 Nucleoside-diphosphate-sugar epimerase [Streptomyces sp. DvalAA-14]